MTYYDSTPRIMYLCTGNAVTHPNQPLQEEDARRVLKDLPPLFAVRESLNFPQTSVIIIKQCVKATENSGFAIFSTEQSNQTII